MKPLLALLLLIAGTLCSTAQKRTTMATQWREFRPSVITLKDGRQLKEPLTNIFLKNSSLLYMSGGVAKEANMDNVAVVAFDDRRYENIGKHLAWYVATGGNIRLYCVELFDMDSYERNLRNNNTITNLDLGSDQLSTTTVDLNTDEDWQFPVFRHYYMYYKGEYVRMHERDIWHVLPKDKRHIYKSIVSQDHFSWTDRGSLVQLLEAISE